MTQEQYTAALYAGATAVIAGENGLAWGLLGMVIGFGVGWVAGGLMRKIGIEVINKSK